MTAAPERVRSREQMRNGLKLIKFAKGSTMLDDAPWEWGSTGGWCNGMPDFFQVHAGERTASRGTAAAAAARGLPSGQALARQPGGAAGQVIWDSSDGPCGRSTVLSDRGRQLCRAFRLGWRRIAQPREEYAKKVN